MRLYDSRRTARLLWIALLPCLLPSARAQDAPPAAPPPANGPAVPPTTTAPNIPAPTPPPSSTPDVAEDFAYAPGADLSGQGGGTGWASPWTGSGLPIAAGGGVRVAAPRGAFLTAGRDMAGIVGRPGMTEWISVVITRTDIDTGASNPPPYGGMALGDAAGLFLGDVGDGHWGMDTSGPSALKGVVDAGPIKTGVPTLLVVRAEFRPGPDLFTLYQDPAPGQSAPSGPGVAKTDLNQVPTSRLQIAYGNGDGYRISSIRLGPTFASVLPGAAPASGIAVGHPDPNAEAEAAILAAYGDRTDALDRQDIDTLLALQTADFTLTGPDGKTRAQTPAAARKALKADFAANSRVLEDANVVSYTFDDPPVGATVTAHVRRTLVSRHGSVHTVTDYEARDFWIFKNDQWRLAHRHLQPAAPPPPAPAATPPPTKP